MAADTPRRNGPAYREVSIYLLRRGDVRHSDGESGTGIAV